MRALNTFLADILSADFGKLLLRFMLGFLMIFHGIHKYQYGIGGIKALVVNAGFPEVFAYGVYIGELIIPVFLILGLYTRVCSFISAVTMFFAIYLVFWGNLLGIDPKTGGLLIETPFLFLLGALSLMFIGAGKFSFDRD